MATQTRDRNKQPATPSSAWKGKRAAQAMTVLISGAIFGFSIEKSRVFEPSVVFQQMLLKKFIMLKMFLSAVIAAMFTMSLLSMIPATSQKFLIARQTMINRIKGPYGRGYFTVVLGGAILGAGMTVAGSCPGVVFAQIGSGTTNSVYTLLGTLAGVFLYGLTEPMLMSLTKPKEPLKNQFLFQILGSPYFITSLPIAAILGIVVFYLELSFPWYTEIFVSGYSIDLKAANWPPILCGGIIGCLQIPLILAIDRVLGAGTSYCTIASQILITKYLQSKMVNLVRFKWGFHNWWKVIFVVSAIGGAFLSSQLAGTYGTVEGMSPVFSFCGGAVMIVGARLAEGCTSGHGISGVGLLYMLSIATIISMFVGGMCTAKIIVFLQ